MFTGIVEEVGTLRRITPGRRRACVLDFDAAVVTEDAARGRQHPHRRRLPHGHGAARRRLQRRRHAGDGAPDDALGAPARRPRSTSSARSRCSSRLGGHLVSGHIDGVGTVTSVTPEDNALVVEVEAPEAVSRVTVDQGSVALDGVSLTVVGVAGDRLRVSLIPHTAEVTTLGRLTRRLAGQSGGRPDRQVRVCVRRRAQARRRTHLGEASGSGVLMTVDRARGHDRRRGVRAAGAVRNHRGSPRGDPAGRMVIVCDDEDRENEGDLTMAAQNVTAEAINFMATHGRGLICLSLTAERRSELEPAPMTSDNKPAFGRRSPSPSRRGTASPRASRPPTGRTPSRCHRPEAGPTISCSRATCSRLARPGGVLGAPARPRPPWTWPASPASTRRGSSARS